MKYKLIRSKRKSVVIDIRDGNVTVKAPLRTSQEFIEAFIEKKSGWIQKKLQAHARTAALFGGIIDGRQILYHGKILDIEQSDAVKRVTIRQSALLVPQKYFLSDSTVSAVKNFYKRTAASELGERLCALAQATGLKYNEISLTNAKTKWGSCDGNCNIKLNWRLLMLDDELRDYVMIHELVHTLHHDHSAAFWNDVKKFVPNLNAVKKRLKSYAVLTTLYR